MSSATPAPRSAARTSRPSKASSSQQARQPWRVGLVAQRLKWAAPRAGAGEPCPAHTRPRASTRPWRAFESQGGSDIPPLVHAHVSQHDLGADPELIGGVGRYTLMGDLNPFPGSVSPPPVADAPHGHDLTREARPCRASVSLPSPPLRTVASADERCRLTAGSRGDRSGARRPVIDCELGCSVDVLRREQHDDFRGRASGGVHGNRRCCSGAVVGEV